MTNLSFTFNKVFISLTIKVSDCDGMWVEGKDLSDNVVRISKDYLHRNLDSLLYDLVHEYWHLRQKEIYDDVLALKKVKSSSPFFNYSQFDRLEEEAEAWALLVTQGVGATKAYFFDSQEKVDWLLGMKNWFASLGFQSPEADWAQAEFDRYKASNTPPPLPWD